MFDRLLTENPRLHPEMLCTQFRMHPLIRMWPSRAFYSNRLEDGVAADQRPPPDGFPWPAAGPAAFLDANVLSLDAGRHLPIKPERGSLLCVHLAAREFRAFDNDARVR